MNRVTESMSCLRPLVKALVITAFTLLFSHVAIYDLTSISFFSPMEKAADFRFSDFYTIVADRGPVAKYEKDIVIVPVDGCDRSQMAKAISDIDYCGPAAVGIDILFSQLHNSNEDPLVEALSECDNLIMPVVVVADSARLRISHGSFYDKVVEPSGGFAAVNIQGSEEEHVCVRKFRKGFDTDEGFVKTLAPALVSAGFPETARILDGRSNESESIIYSSREFEFVYPDEILDNKDLIKGRIVLVGKLQDRADFHVTPLQNFTPGLMVHAYIAATILGGDYTRQLSILEEIVLGALLCFLVVWINLHLMRSVMGPLLVRSLQIGLLYFLILTGTLVYVNYNVDLNFSYSILTVSLGVAACEVYGAIFDPNGLIDYILTKIRNNTGHEGKKTEEGSIGNDCTSDNSDPSGTLL